MMYFIYFAMIAICLFAPVYLYRRRSRLVAKFCLFMACSDNCIKFYCYIILLQVIGIHSLTYNIKPLEYGLMVSSILMFIMFNVKWTRKFLELLASDIRKLYGLMIVTLLVSFVPHLLTLGITMAFIIAGVCFYPSEEVTKRERQIMVRDYNIACRRNDFREFIDTYFLWRKKRITERPKMEVIIGKQNPSASAAPVEDADAEEIT